MKRLVACALTRLYQCGFVIAIISGASGAAPGALRAQGGGLKRGEDRDKIGPG